MFYRMLLHVLLYVLLYALLDDLLDVVLLCWMLRWLFRCMLHDTLYLGCSGVCFHAGVSPVVHVDCFGQKQQKACAEKGVSNCVFDELFIFQLKNVDKADITEGLIRISVDDAGLCL